MVMQFYKQIWKEFNWLFITSVVYKSANPLEEDIRNCLQHVFSKINIEMNDITLKTFTEFVIKETLFQMASLKSLGFDGFGAIFYLSI